MGRGGHQIISLSSSHVPFHSITCQECESEGANAMIAHLRDIIAKSKKGDKFGKCIVKKHHTEATVEIAANLQQ